ncbi:hypothetical protein L873DRAFT_1801636, partial [Choiromyces venosus 120613-1]
MTRMTEQVASLFQTQLGTLQGSVLMTWNKQTQAVMNAKLHHLEEGQARLENKLEMKFDKVDEKFEMAQVGILTPVCYILAGVIAFLCI